MPGLSHEAIVQLVHCNPQLAPFLLASTGYPVPAGAATLADSNLPHPKPKELRSDVVVTVGEYRSTRLAVIVEPQTSEPNRKKRRAWLGYLAVAGIEHDCDTVLMPIAPGRTVARLCARPFRPGHPDLILVPVVIGPDNTPHPDSPGAGYVTAELTVLGVLTRVLDLTDPGTRRYVRDKLLLTTVRNSQIYNRIIYNTASRAVRKLLEEDMAVTDWYVPYIDGPIQEAKAQAQALVEEATAQANAQVEEARAHANAQVEEARAHANAQVEEARAQANAQVEEAKARAAQAARAQARGEAKSLLRVLEARGFAVTGEIRDRVMTCARTSVLDAWIDRAVSAESVREVFED